MCQCVPICMKPDGKGSHLNMLEHQKEQDLSSEKPVVTKNTDGNEMCVVTLFFCRVESVQEEKISHSEKSSHGKNRCSSRFTLGEFLSCQEDVMHRVEGRKALFGGKCQ